jgi:hypothetical protein
VSFVLVWTSRYMPNHAPSDPVGATSLDESADAWRCGGHGFLERYWTIRGFLTFPFAFSQENDSCQDENWLLPIMAPQNRNKFHDSCFVSLRNRPYSIPHQTIFALTPCLLKDFCLHL